MTVEFSQDRRYLYVHTLDIETPEQVKQGIRQGLERYIIEAL
ncbi:MAG: Na+/H+ antiporter subunit E [Dehalococcoidia bacterium]